MATELKDYRWQIQGDFDFQDIELSNIEFRVHSVFYRATEKKADIEIIAKEALGTTSFSHSRTWTVDVSGDQEGLDRAAIVAAVGALFPTATQTFPIV